MFSYKLFNWLSNNELKKIAESLENGNKKIMDFVFKSDKKSITVRFDEIRISNHQTYHLFGKIILGIDEGHEVHIQYDAMKQKGTLNIYI